MEYFMCQESLRSFPANGPVSSDLSSRYGDKLCSFGLEPGQTPQQVVLEPNWLAL